LKLTKQLKVTLQKFKSNLKICCVVLKIDCTVTFSFPLDCRIAEKLETKDNHNTTKPQHRPPLGGEENWALCSPLLLLSFTMKFSLFSFWEDL
jgi:hypothetical protein